MSLEVTLKICGRKRAATGTDFAVPAAVIVRQIRQLITAIGMIIANQHAQKVWATAYFLSGSGWFLNEATNPDSIKRLEPDQDTFATCITRKRLF